MSNDKLVKSSELPLNGNPHPPKDVVKEEPPSFLEQNVSSVRTQLQPYMAPVCRAYKKTSDVLAIGVAHTRSTLDSLRENQTFLYNAMIISGYTLAGVFLARKRGIIKKTVFTSLGLGIGTVVCYPNEAKEKSELAYFIAKNKLPELFKYK